MEYEGLHAPFAEDHASNYTSEGLETRRRINEYLWSVLGPESGASLKDIRNLARIGSFQKVGVWHARLIFAEYEECIWIVSEPRINFYTHMHSKDEKMTRIRNAAEAAIMHIGMFITFYEPEMWDEMLKKYNGVT